MEDYYWSTMEYHHDNTHTMNDYLDNHLPDGAEIIMQDGNYAVVEYYGEKFALNAVGNGDSYNHKVEIAVLP